MLIEFTKFSDAIRVEPDSLYRALCEFHAKDGQNFLSKRALQKIRSHGITQQAGRVRDFLRNFARSPQSQALDLSPEDIDDFLGGLASPARESDTDLFGELLNNDADVFRTLSALFSIRNSNSGLRTARSQYAGYFYLVRRTSREGAEHYYEEPFLLADQGHQSFMIPYQQDAQLGFSLASAGACTTILFNRHHERTVGISVVMLYGQNNPKRAVLPGVMLRFSDDTARPSACQVLARRVYDERITSKWQSELDDIAGRVARDPDAPETIDAVRGISSFANRVDPSSEESSLFRIYQAFELKFMAKALDQAQWEAALDRATLTDEQLEARFQE